MAVKIREVDSTRPEELQAALRLIHAYVKWLGVDLTFQKFDEEMAAMPGKYGPPTGALLVAYHDEKPIGVVGLRGIVPEGDERSGCCEMKRLYVLPEGRGTGAGRALVEGVIAQARQLGYREMVLDSLPWMAAAQALYERYGFERSRPYYFNPNEGVVWRSLKLV